MNATDFEKIRNDNIEEYGKGTRHLAYFSDLYTTRTHFLYELLQNAEDALRKRNQRSPPSGYVKFELQNNRLLIMHNGRPFNEADVKGVCGIGEGTKADDVSQIWKFGIGFKSVYGYTAAPRLHSERLHFEIRRFVEPHALPENGMDTSNPGETCIELTFDTYEGKPDRISPAKAVDEIANALKTLGLRSLLFLRHTEEISWSLPDGTSGTFLRDTRPAASAKNARYVDVTVSSTKESWLIFHRDMLILFCCTSVQCQYR